ncbi:MFS general substrate transporter [Dacryopinax primogenitus]|uniref:MFS general substrate transporter n=1 Tax=Dacryopinax primogenitus (strain DJM 731) TaxID=1858805 RepID=M5G430_DACPD|nr:MFS general substrate transporter [Dacryopinax primogenitus]EJU03434.1 MFS general substrate transporter [Dacryopinax primogenitus]
MDSQMTLSNGSAGGTHEKTRPSGEGSLELPTPSSIEAVVQGQEKPADRASAPTLPHHTYPEGGLRGWLTVAGAWLCLVCTFGYTNAYGVYQSYYVQTMLPSSSTSAISWIGSLQLFFLFAMGLPTGRLFDAGYFRHLMIGGMVIMVGSLFAQSAAQHDQYYQVFLSQAVGQGIGGGMLYLPAISIISHYFQKRRALAIGVVQSGSSTGGIVFPILLSNLFVEVGYVWAVRITGFIMLGLLLAANLLASPRLAPKKDHPKPDLRRFFTDPPYITAVLGMVLVWWGLFYPFFYIQLFASSHGLSDNYAFYTIAIINAASMIGRTLPNVFADKTGIMPLLVPSTAVSAILLLILIACTNMAGVTVFCVLFGLFSGAFISLMAPMFAIMSDHVFEIGIRFGFSIFIMAFAGLTGTPITGALVGNSPPYIWYRPCVFAGVCMLGGTGLLTFSWLALGRKQGHLMV